MFSNHQNDPLLKSILEGINEELATVIKKHNLGWSALHTNALTTLADQLFKTIEGEDMSIKVVNLRDFPGGTVVKNPPANADTGSSPGLGRSHMLRSNY